MLDLAAICNRDFGPNFERGYGHVMAHEGGYVNDPVDTGGETYAGVSRVNHPDWPGWTIVDRLKPDNGAMAGNSFLQAHLKRFYYEKFWLASKADTLAPALGRKHFNVAVNCGVKRAVILLQKAVGVKPDGTFIVKPDGVFGPKTMSAVYQAETADLAGLLDRYCREQRAFYLGIIERKPSQARFKNGWLRRAEYRG
jgi:lysozyme family protein